MSDAEPPQTRRSRTGSVRPRRFRRLRRAWRMGGGLLAGLVAVVLALALLGALLIASGREFALPDHLARQLEARINRDLPGFDLSLGGLGFRLREGGDPELTLSRVALAAGSGGAAAEIARIRARFELADLLAGRWAPARLSLSGAMGRLMRDAEGRLGLALGQGGPPLPLPQLLDRLDGAMAAGPLQGLDRAALTDLELVLEDARSNRVWTLTGGRLVLERRDGGAELGLSGAIFNGTEDLAELRLSLRTAAGDSGAVLQAEFSDVPAPDIALQSPALAALAALEAPISGALRAVLGPSGRPEGVAGTLTIGPGALKPRAQTAPVPFDLARAYFEFDPARDRIDLREITASGRHGQVSLGGHAYLAEPGPDGWPRAVLVQLQLDRLDAVAPDWLEAPVRLTDGAADFRIRLDPFTLDLGQLSLATPGRDADQGESRVLLRGQVAADPDGWRVALDAETDRLPVDRLMGFWPLKVAPKTRGWLDENLLTGTATGVHGALRWQAGRERQLAARFDFEGAALRFLRDMPVITGGSGHAAVVDDRFALHLDSGQVTLPERGTLRIGGSTLVVPDTRQKPSRGQFDIRAEGPIPALLAALDRQPLELMAKAGRGPDLLSGGITGRARFELPFAKGLKRDDVTLDVEALAEDVRSDRLVPGRELTADRLAVVTDGRVLDIGGDIALGGVPVTARYRQGLGGEDRSGRVTGQVAISPAALEAFGIRLPDGLVTGQGRGDLAVTLERGAPPRFALSSDLAGIGMAIPALDWRKTPGATGRFEIAGRLGADPVVDAMTLEAAGLSAAGGIALAEGGGFEALELSRLRLGGWLDAAARIEAQGPGQPPAIALTGGRLSLHRRPEAQVGGNAAGQGAPHGPIRIGLDRLELTENIALAPFTARIAAGRGMDGRFEGRINGGTRVEGALAAVPQGTAMRIRAADGGQLLRDAGLYDKLRDGQTEIVLTPTGAPGAYEGSLLVEGPRIRGAPVVADLLGAISVVGLIEQLNGRGIVFDEARARFRLTPRAITLYGASAIGASLGISLDGVYDRGQNRLDMQGVISPVYLLNSIGSIFTRRGEGLFGFNFRLTGAAARPDVSVNPLSILTPGMFREIFRRAPPEPPAQN